MSRALALIGVLMVLMAVYEGCQKVATRNCPCPCSMAKNQECRP